MNDYTGAVAVLLPTKAISIISAQGKPFHDPEADRALFASLREHLDPGVPLKEFACEINDPEFAKACAETLLGLLD